MTKKDNSEQKPSPEGGMDRLVFITRPIKVKDGTLVPGPISRHQCQRTFSTLAHLKTDAVNIGLQDYHFTKASGEVIEGRQTPCNYREVPNGNLCFHKGKCKTAEEKEIMDKIREAVFNRLLKLPDGIYVVVGFAWGYHNFLTRDQLGHSLDVRGWDNNYDIIEAHRHEAIEAAWRKWLAVLDDQHSQSKKEEVAQTPEGEREVYKPVRLTPVGVGFHTAQSPIDKFMRGRKPLVLTMELGSGEPTRKYYGHVAYPSLWSDAVAVLGMAASPETAKLPLSFSDSVPTGQGVDHIRPTCLDHNELLAFAKWCANSRALPSYSNTWGSAIPTLKVDGSSIIIGGHAFTVSETGVYLPDGRALNNAVVVWLGREGKPDQLTLVNSFGLFAQFLAESLDSLRRGSASRVGAYLARNLPFAEKSGTAGGGLPDSDRLRWEMSQFVVWVPNGFFSRKADAKNPFWHKCEITNIVFSRWGLVPVPNGNFVDGRLIAYRREDGKVVLSSNKETKLAKRIAQQYGVSVHTERTERKRSVIAWNGPGITSLPSEKVWREKVCISLSLIFTPGAIIELAPSERRIINRVQKSDFPALEVDPSNPVEVLPEPEDKIEGTTIALIKGINGDVPIKLPTDCDSYKLSYEVVRSFGYPRVHWHLVCLRLEETYKYRGTLKGIGTPARLTIPEGTSARLLVPSDANKSNDSILGPLDYIAETVFAPENANDEFCQSLKKQLVELNRRMYGKSAPADYAILSLDFESEYQEIIRQFWNHFAQAKWFIFECDKSYAEVMLRLRITEDNVPIKGWEYYEGDVPKFIPPHSVVLADGDYNDIRTDVIAVWEEPDGSWRFAQRSCCLDEVGGASVFWPVKIEYTTVAQSAGYTRLMPTQLLVACKSHKQLTEPWLRESTYQLAEKSEAVLSFFSQEEGEPFEGTLAGEGALEKIVADLPQRITIKAGGETLTINPHAVAKLGGDGHDEMSLPELLREVLAAGEEDRPAAIRRFKSAFLKAVQSYTFWKGGRGPKCVTAKVMGLPHIPLGEVWVKWSHKSHSVYRLLVKLYGPRLNGMKVFIGRAPMADMCPLRLRIIHEGHRDHGLLSESMIYYNPLVTSWHGGDCDGDNNILVKADSRIQCLTLEALLQNLRERTGSDQLAAINGDIVYHGDQYIADWYAIKRPESLLSKRKGFIKTLEEAAELFEGAETQHDRIVGLTYTCGFQATVYGLESASAMMNVYEVVLGGFERKLFQAFSRARKGERVDWLGAGLPSHLAKEMDTILALSRRAIEQETLQDVLLEISRGRFDQIDLNRLRKMKFNKDDLATRIVLEYLKIMAPAIEVATKSLPTTG